MLTEYLQNFCIQPPKRVTLVLKGNSDLAILSIFNLYFFSKTPLSSMVDDVMAGCQFIPSPSNYNPIHLDKIKESTKANVFSKVPSLRVKKIEKKD